MGGAGMPCAGLCNGSAFKYGGGMSDMELVSLCALAMAGLNLYLVYKITQVGKAINMAWEIILDVAKGNVRIEWDEKQQRINVLKP